MFIKKLKTGKNEYVFDESKKIVLVKENQENAGAFYKTVKDVFCTRNLWLDCVCTDECDLYCECEKSGINFQITVNTKAKGLTDKKNVVGLTGDFEVSCKFEPTEPLSDEQKRLLRLIKGDFQDALFPRDNVEYIAFFRRLESLDYTQTVLSDEYIKIKKAEPVVNEFVKNYQELYLGTLCLGFNGQDNSFEFFAVDVIPDLYELDKKSQGEDGQTENDWAVFSLWDYITANRLNEKLQSFYGFDGKTPLIIENAFEGMSEKDIKWLTEEIKSLDRQTFIIEKTKNAYLESLCDEKVVFTEKPLAEVVMS